MTDSVKIEIKVGGLYDLDEALRVADLVFEPEEAERVKYHNLEDWKEKLKQDGVLILGIVNGVVVGFILAFKKTESTLHVWNAGVLGEFRGMGIFSNMFEELTVVAKKRGVRKLTLNTIEKKFPAMYRLVINKGFKEYEREWVEDSTVGKVEKSKFSLDLE